MAADFFVTRPVEPKFDEGKPSRLMETLIVVRVIAGTALLIAPGRVLGDLPHQEIKGSARVFARVLGARHLVEAGVLLRGRSHRWARIGSGVDAVHGATMLALAAARPAERRLALTNAVTAGTLACAGMVAAAHGYSGPCGDGRATPAARTSRGVGGAIEPERPSRTSRRGRRR